MRCSLPVQIACFVALWLLVPLTALGVLCMRVRDVLSTRPWSD